MKPAVYVHQARVKNVISGHPWVFPKAILRTTGTLQTGSLVDVYSDAGVLLGVGAYNEYSLYRVRVLARAFESIDSTSIQTLVRARLKEALLIRKQLGLPNAMTNAYRLFNSEADLLSGLTIDRFNNTLVVASSAFWVEHHRAEIQPIIAEMVPCERVLWVSQVKPLAQDGFKEIVKEVNAFDEEVLEAGVAFKVDFSTSQKTGLFLDQRENHQRVGKLAKGKRVLDLYTYTGGFALHAAMGKATSVTAVDSSMDAIALAKRNASLNKLSNIDFIEADARDFLSKAGDYDLIILDPPKLVPSQKHLARAKNYYRFLHLELFKYMQSGTLLMTCNCSSALSTMEFIELVSQVAQTSGKTARILGIYGPSSCHPMLASFKEGQYLTAVLLSLG